MKRNLILLAGFLASALAAGLVAAATAGHPYRDAIARRNLFDLKSPKSEISPIQPKPVRAIKLAGLTSIFGKKLAILRVPSNEKPFGSPEVSVLLGEGAAEEGVQVLEINVSAGTVRIMNGDTEQLLDIAKDAPRAGSTPAITGGSAPGLVKVSVAATAAPDEHVPAETAAIVYATWRMRDQPKVAAGEMPPYPPTELSEMLEQEQRPPHGNQ